MDRADAEIVATIRADCGLHVKSIDDLVNTRDRYPEAYPVLLDLLNRDFPIRMREMIIRALTVRDARDQAFDQLVQLYTEPQSTPARQSIGYESYRYALANAISVLAGKADRDVLKKFASDRRNGQSRSAFIYSMSRWKDSDVDAIVLGALSDPHVQHAAIEVAGARRLESAAANLGQLSHSTDKELSRAAARALKRLAR